jgi:hypothetical protein
MSDDVLPPFTPATHDPRRCWALCTPECTAPPPEPEPRIAETPAPRAPTLVNA